MNVLARLDKVISSMVFTMSKDQLWDAATIELVDTFPYYCQVSEDSSTTCIYLSRSTSLTVPFLFFAEYFVIDQELPEDYNYRSSDPFFENHTGLFYDNSSQAVESIRYDAGLDFGRYTPVYEVNVPPAPLALRKAILEKLQYEQFVQVNADRLLEFETGGFLLKLELFNGEVFELMEDSVKHCYEIDTGCVNIAFHDKLFGSTFTLLGLCSEGYQWDASNIFWEERTARWAPWDKYWKKIEKQLKME